MTTNRRSAILVVIALAIAPSAVFAASAWWSNETSAQPEPPHVQLQVVTDQQLISHGVHLRVPDPSRAKLTRNEAEEVLQNEYRMPADRASGKRVVPVVEGVLAQVHIDNQANSDCLCWVFVDDEMPPLQGPDQEYVQKKGTWFIQFVDATTGEWWGAKASVALRDDIATRVANGETIPPTGSWAPQPNPTPLFQGN